MAKKMFKSRLGCMLLGLALLAAWSLGGWALWQASMRAPLPDKDEKSTPFEFIPSQEGE